MGGKKPARDGDADERKEPLQAVLLADSFAQSFRPITLERPKVLLPLVNSPMINYTLEWLCSGGVEEVFVFCCSHAKQIQAYLESSSFARMPNFVVHTIVQSPCLSVGEALRLIDQKDVIKGDFILISGDTVANFQLDVALEAHRKRREKDKLAIMTMVTKPGGSNSFYRDRRLGEGEVVFTTDPGTNQVLHYKEFPRPGGGGGGGGGGAGGAVKVDAFLFQDRDTVAVRTDLLDCQVDICAPEVLMLFTDNFDYQDMRRDFVAGVLSEEELGNKIYLHELTAGEYATRVSTARSYDAASRDILHRWTFPMVPDTNVLAHQDVTVPPNYSYSRRNVYKEDGVQLARSARVGPACALGAGTTIGDNSVVKNSVIGRGCHVGDNVHIDGCYIHDNVTVGGGVTIRHALVCDGSVIHAQAQILPGAILSYKTVIGSHHTVPGNARVSLCRQRQRGGGGGGDGSDASSDDDYLETGGNDSGDDDEEEWGSSDDDAPAREQPSSQVLAAAEALAVGHVPHVIEAWDEAAVGSSGAGFLWQGREDPGAERLSSIAPPPMECALHEDASDDEGPRRGGGAGAGAGGGGGADGAGGDGGGEEDEEEEDDDPEAVFRREVSETFLRCVREKFDQTNAVIELNALKIAEDRTFADCARYVLLTLMALGLPAPRDTNPDYRRLFAQSMPEPTPAGKTALVQGFAARLAEWKGLLQRFLKVDDDQIELMLTIEEWCSEDGVVGARDASGVYGEMFMQVLKLLYDQDILGEDALLQWADEKKHCTDPSDLVFFERARPFIQWLQEADSESEDSDSD